MSSNQTTGSLMINCYRCGETVPDDYENFDHVTDMCVPCIGQKTANQLEYMDVSWIIEAENRERVESVTA
jgi:hypothetical protein